MASFSMRVWIGLSLLGLVPCVAAQTVPLDPPRDGEAMSLQSLGILDPEDAPATPALADVLFRALGRPWTEVLPTLPAADSSFVEDGFGEVYWSVPGVPVDGFRAFVQHGLVESVTLDFSRDGPDLAAFARRLYDRLGSPRADGFYATDQTGYPFSLAIDPQANRLDARAVPGQLQANDPK